MKDYTLSRETIAELEEYIEEHILPDAKDVEEILQVQPFAFQWSLSLRERNNSEILQGCYRKRAYARDYRHDTVVWEPDKGERYSQ
jgi:hypothetical protein